MSYIVLVGASSAIAQAVAKQILQRNQKPNQSVQQKLILISSKPTTEFEHNDRVIAIDCDYSEQAICSAIEQVDKRVHGDWQQVTQVIIFNGVLHNPLISPEKRLEDVSAHALSQLYQSNTIVPFLFVKQVALYLSHQCRCQLIVFSARVGSINDNKLGGWYGYRSSKAALNMLLQTAAIELRRRAKQCMIVAFHPGTTDTPLSRPFQANVKPQQLFSPDFVAIACLNVTANLVCDGHLHYVDWQGKPIEF
ncbi:SDR family NAD(P)-dependent oxidoreductase [Thalassotalea ponticola]|uniref:SDR family NAD(P)-dependent oxidoreductase n=1 Tax=Thalassotalea ponticola TaxID=1523392 RepID=UPI0025B2B62F|nr:SDR family NAD(P)-dependent oxidoreductase [Thalassotalea ponticola]MDN3652222.1 SDR family NAD(P)-dependent oxidoreductase [Thalassotalea ponticola]